MLDRWLAKDRLHRLHFEEGEDKNPEFRIATQAPIDLAASCLTAVLSAVTFIGVLWHASGDLTVQIDGQELTVPKYLVITVCAYSALLTGAMMFIGRDLVHVIAGKNAAEAQFRSVASHVRERGAAALLQALDETEAETETERDAGLSKVPALTVE